MSGFSEATRRYVLGVLVVVYTFNFIDRQILSILLDPIKHALGLTDTDLGWLAGPAFAVFYATLGMPIARWADRRNRRNLIAAALSVWSATTALSGLAINFWTLFAARVGVGVGEAGCSPAAHAIIADYYPPARRATALGIYALGIPIGILFGFLAGGWINQFFGWRNAFFVVGLPGLALALIVRLTIAEPSRGLSEGRTTPAAQPAIGETMRFLWSRRSFRHLTMGAALTAYVGYSVVGWVPTFLGRSFGLSSGVIGTALGLVIGIPGGIGIVLGGRLADRFGARDPRWYLWIVAIALLAGLPFTFGVFLAPTWTISLGCLIVPVLLGNFYQATTFSQTQGLAGLRMRAVASSVMLFIVTIIGLALGPWSVGVLSDVFAPRFGQESLRYALLAVSFVNVWSAVHFYIGGRYLGADLKAAPA